MHHHVAEEIAEQGLRIKRNVTLTRVLIAAEPDQIRPTISRFRRKLTVCRKRDTIDQTRIHQTANRIMREVEIGAGTTVADGTMTEVAGTATARNPGTVQGREIARGQQIDPETGKFVF